MPTPPTPGLQSDTDFLTGIMADLNGNRQTAEALEVLIGERHLAEHSTTQRIVWIPMGDSFSPPLPGIGTEGFRTLITDAARWAVHIRGGTIADTRELMHEVVRSCLRVCSKVYFTPESAEWNTEGELEQDSALVILFVTFKIGIVDRVSTKQTIETITAAVSESDAGGEVDFTLTAGS